jgi:hypothetical protein
MATVQVGYRRLYDAVGCALRSVDEHSYSMPVGDQLTVRVYFGPHPPVGVTEITAGKYIGPGANGEVQFRHVKDAADSRYAGHFFTEIVVHRTIEVPDELRARLHASDPDAPSEIFAKCSPYKPELQELVDCVAGAIGLKVQRQFVLEVISDSNVIFREDGDPAVQMVSPALELIDSISLSAEGLLQTERLLAAVVSAPADARAVLSSAFFWLLRAWPERDRVSKFVALFIPLEIILAEYTAGPQTELRQQGRAIRKLIRQHGGSECDSLMVFFNGLMESQHPTLSSRFKRLAETAGLRGWEADVAAFDHFNLVRNALVHRGEPEVSMSITVGEGEVRLMEDLVERYLSLHLFGNADVYRSTRRWRISAQQATDTE